MSRSHWQGLHEHRLHVVAAAIVDPVQRKVLLARRPDDKHMGGLWEFPGGKVEPGENSFAALRRELHEEIGIDISAAEPLIAVPWDYPARSIVLDTWCVTAFQGEPHGREGQPVRWVSFDELTALDFPSANRPIITALRLPDHYVITPDIASPAEASAFIKKLTQLLATDVALLLLRCPSLKAGDYRALAADVLALCRAARVQLLLHDDPAHLQAVDADGLHMRASRLRQQGPVCRELAAGKWLAASCHDQEELQLAEQAGCDFVTLAPVHVTRSHPQAPAMGQQKAAWLTTQRAMPVYWLGGMTLRDVSAVRALGSRGIAGISAFWP